MACVGVLVGKAGVCQKSLPLTEGMIHSGERQHPRRDERKRQERGSEGARESERGGAEMLIRDKQPRMLI